jgi:dihydrofolate synthase/folylpolyglutamate synthase
VNDRERADRVYSALLRRQGERWVQPRVERTRRVLELLDDPQRTYRVVHVTGTNGKTSTSRMIESLVRAHGLRTGLFTSPHLERFTERIMIDGEPIGDAPVADAWEEIAPFVDLVDAELEAAGDAPLTFFELLTVLAFVAFADAPIDVLVLEVGMGGAWDSTNTADGDVAVIAPIDIDHADRLGETIAEIAAVKAGIIGGQLISVQGLVGRYDDEYLPLYGGHQGFNAALAIAAVESLIGGASHEIPGDILAEGLGQVTSPGRLQLVGVAPTVLVDAAHNPHGARALATALRESFDFEEWGVVLGVLDDKDADGIVAALAPVASHVFATAPGSERARDADRVADLAEARGLQVTVHSDASDAAEAARSWAAASDRRAVVIAGSVILAGEALALATAENWKAGWDE